MDSSLTTGENQIGHEREDEDDYALARPTAMERCIQTEMFASTELRLNTACPKTTLSLTLVEIRPFFDKVETKPGTAVEQVQIQRWPSYSSLSICRNGKATAHNLDVSGRRVVAFGQPLGAFPMAQD
jgi:hypothetical protein